MLILQQSAVFSSTILPAYPLLAAPPQRLALPAPRMPKIAGLLPAPQSIKLAKRVVVAEIIEQPRIDINIYKDPEGFWAEFERIFGPDKSIEEMDAELEAKHPGYLAWVARMDAAREAARS